MLSLFVDFVRSLLPEPVWDYLSQYFPATNPVTDFFSRLLPDPVKDFLSRWLPEAKPGLQAGDKGFVFEWTWFWILPPLIGLGIPIVAALLMLWAGDGQIQDLPYVIVLCTEDMKEKVFEAYKKFTKTKGIFRVKHPAHQIIMLTTSTMNELTSRPEAEVSTTGEVADRFSAKYTGIGIYQPVLRKAMAQHLVKISEASVPQLLQECTITAQQEIGSGKDAASIPVERLASRIVAKFMGVMIAGREFGHDETWLRIGTQHFADAVKVSDALESVNSFLKPMAAIFTEKSQLDRDRPDLQALIRPFVEDRLKSPVSEKGPTDLLEAIIDTAPPDQTSVIEMIANCILDLTMLANATTSDLLSHALSDLASHKDTQPILLEEVKQVLAGRSFNALTQTDLNKMHKLDSFLKESQRLSPNSTIGLSREIVKKDGIQLSNSLLLPQGTYVAVSPWSINRDPDLWTEPEEFDALRFYKLRQKPGEGENHQFVTLSDTSISFGAASGGCPGRTLACNELKIVVAFLVLNYQIDLAEKSDNSLEATGARVAEDVLVSFKLKQ